MEFGFSNFAQNFRTDLREIFREGWQWASEQLIKFWWRSGSGIRIRIATLQVRRALAEVSTVPVLLVSFKIKNKTATGTIDIVTADKCLTNFIDCK